VGIRDQRRLASWPGVVVTVHGYPLKSLNTLLRGTNHKSRAAARKRELENVCALILSQNERPERPIETPVSVYFVHLYATARPDVDGYWKLVGDALEKMRWICDDGLIEELVLTRMRVQHKHQEGFECAIKPTTRPGRFWSPGPKETPP